MDDMSKESDLDILLPQEVSKSDVAELEEHNNAQDSDLQNKDYKKETDIENNALTDIREVDMKQDEETNMLTSQIMMAETKEVDG